MTVRFKRIASMALALLCQAACGGHGDESSVADDGVRVVASEAPSLEGPSAWSISAEPLLQLGRAEGEGGDIFDHIGDMILLPDGTLVVANRGDNTIRFFDAEGLFLRSVGGTGDGPGEFRGLGTLELLGDEILGIQFFLVRPIHVFDRQGEYVRTIHAPLPDDNPALTVQGTLGDGSLLATSWPQGMPVEHGVYTQDSQVYRLDAATGAATHLLSLPGMRFVDTGGIRGKSQTYGPHLVLAARGDALYVGWPESYVIDVRNRDGTLDHRIRAAVPLRSVTAADEEAVRDAALALDTVTRAGARVQPREDRLRDLDRMIYPETHPAYQSFKIDQAGNLWVNRHWGPPEHPARGQQLASGMTWDVFDPGGSWLTTVFTPPGFWPLWFGEDRVAGLWRDDLGVDYVRVYALQK